MNWEFWLQVFGFAVLGVLLPSVIVIFVGVLRVIWRADLVIYPPGEEKLPFFERTYRRHQRAGQLFVSDKYRLERRLIGFGALGIAAVMAIAGLGALATHLS